MHKPIPVAMLVTYIHPADLCEYLLQAHRICKQLHNMNLNDLHGNTIGKVLYLVLMNNAVVFKCVQSRCGTSAGRI